MHVIAKQTRQAQDISPAASREPLVTDDIQHDAVFGSMQKNGPNYRNVGWVGTTGLMIKTQIGLGVLSMPVVFETFGIIPGIVLLLIVAGITTWSDYMIGVFKTNHPDVYGIDDVGRMLFGRVGYEIFGTAYILYFTFVAGSAMLGMSIALNALSKHAVCTAVFVPVAAIIVFLLSSIRTLSGISWLAWVGVACMITSILTVTIAVGLQDRPWAAPKEGYWEPDYKIANMPTFTDAISAISALVFSFAGTPGFFNIVAEMRNPKHYTRSLAVCQITVASMYIIVATVVYYFCGSYVSSPALGSAGPLVKKVAYGIALPGLAVSGILLAHLPAMQIFMRILRDSEHLKSNSVTHWVTWIGSTFAVSLAAYLIASGIPIFHDLVSLIGALFGSLLSLQPYGCMWLYDNWCSKDRNMRWRLMVAWSVFVILAGSFLMIAGTYGSIVSIMKSLKEGGATTAWSCADNSNST